MILNKILTKRFTLYTASKLNRKLSTIPTSLKDIVQTDHLIIGGGVIGLAIAFKLSEHKFQSNFLNKTDKIVLLERNSMVGMETSSRNSEVIHAGMYYPSGSLKEKMCITGKHQLYSYCKKYDIPYKRIGKWIVAQNNSTQLDFLTRLKKKGDLLNIKLNYLTKKQAKILEPNINCELILESPTTGIIDSGSFIESLSYEYLNPKKFDNLSDLNNFLQYQSTVVEIIHSPFHQTGNSYLVKIVDTFNPNQSYWLETRCIINASGLAGDNISNLLNKLINPNETNGINYYFCKGNYFKYTGAKPASRLIYPVPDKNLTSLGLHLTLDLNGQTKFGPDIEHLSKPNYKLNYPIFNYGVNEDRKEIFYQAASQYLNNLDKDKFVPDYSGIRPKLTKPNGITMDFSIKNLTKHSSKGGKLIDLVGIESPGLTSSLAIADWVKDQLY